MGHKADNQEQVRLIWNIFISGLHNLEQRILCYASTWTTEYIEYLCRSKPWTQIVTEVEIMFFQGRLMEQWSAQKFCLERKTNKKDKSCFRYNTEDER